MPTSDLPPRLGRPGGVLGGPPMRAPDEAGPTGGLGPGGVWPPPRPSARPSGRSHAADAAGDPPTVPLSVPILVPAREPEPEPAPEVPAERGLVAMARRALPVGWRGARADPGRPGATALALVAAAAAVVAAVGVWVERPRAEPVSGLPGVTVVAEPAAGDAPGQIGTVAPDAAAPPPAPDPSAQAAVPLVVSVSGKVHRPGLVEVPAGSRVADVLEAVGGALPGSDLAGVNLARRVVDGEQIAVGVPAAPDAGPPAAASGGAAGSSAAGAGPAAGKVDLNSATAEQLDVLPGVGPVTVARILEWRTSNGRFSRIEQLREIEGIGERRFAQLRELVVV